jgi:hypothetical protein
MLKITKMSTTKVITGKVRFSYVHVFEPTSVEEGGTKKYNIAVLIPKTDKKTIAAIVAAHAAAAQEGKTSKFGGKIPVNLKGPLRDGDIEKEEDDAYAGMMFLNASSIRRPGVLGPDKNPIFDKDEFYSGCYGRVSLNFYAFSVGGNKGVAAGLNNLMKLEDGDNLGGGASSAADDFGSPDEDDDLN